MTMMHVLTTLVIPLLVVNILPQTVMMIICVPMMHVMMTLVAIILQ
jgi:hypothetical protein